MMRRPIVIIIGFIVLVFIILIVVFGLKGPEMPIQEVHKVIPMSKFQQQTTAPALPTVSVPANNLQPIQPGANPQQRLPAVPQPGAAPGNATGNVGQSAVNPVPQAPLPSAPQPGVTPSNTAPTGQAQPTSQSTVPLIIPQPSATPGNTTGQPGANPQQPLPAVPQPGAVPGNAAGAPAQR